MSAEEQQITEQPVTEQRSAPPPNAMPGTTATPPVAPPPATRGRRKAFTIFFIILLVIAIGGTLFWLHARDFESTDDAEVDAHLNPISSRVDGNVTRVYVDDNQVRKAGDPLVDLDPRDVEVALDQAMAQLTQARSTALRCRLTTLDPVTRAATFSSSFTFQSM